MSKGDIVWIHEGLNNIPVVNTTDGQQTGVGLVELDRRPVVVEGSDQP